MRRFRLSTMAWAALLTAVVGWAAVLLSAPLLGQAAAGGRLGPAVAAAVYFSGGLVCHHRPERSLHLAGAQMPVCGRCTGLYLSTAAGVLLALALRPRTKRAGSSSPPRPGMENEDEIKARGGAGPHFAWRDWLLAAAVPSLLTLALEWSGAWPVSNAARAAAAAPLGFVLGALLVEAAGFRGRL